MALSNVSGFPRIGRNRELKFATEGYWRGETSADELAATAKAIRVENWKLMQDAGIDLIPSNDFSYYDQVLDTIALVGAVPERYGWSGDQVDLDTYFAMARGRQTDDLDVTAMEMTKWFDTNYHYIVPELGPDTRFSLSSSKPFDEHAEAMEELGIDTVPVLIGPVSFLLLSKPAEGVTERFDAIDLIEPLVEVYGEVIERLAEQGATWVQFDEPCFVEDRSEKELDALRLAYEELCKVHERPRIVVKTYFDHVGDAYGVLRDLPIEGVGLDFTGFIHEEGIGFGDAPFHEHGGRHNAEFIADQGGLDDQWLFAGIVDGRNVWINHLEHSLDALEGLQTRTAQLVVSTSCSLLHTPIDLDAEPSGGRRRPRRRDALLDGVRRPEGGRGRHPREGDGRGTRGDRRRARRERPRAGFPARLGIGPETPRCARGSRDSTRSTTSARAHSRSAGRRSAPASRSRSSSPRPRSAPIPQTDEIRQTRAKEKRGEIDWETYKEAMQAEIEKVIRFQEDVGLDVLVHGEPERNDMVQYFGEQMEGYVFTENAWVQSYGSRYVRPPIIFGDVLRPSQMTVDWITYAQSLTDKPVKGMLTGPVTMLEWSFVRDDQPARGHVQAARARDPRRGRGPREGGHPDHPGRRAGDPRGTAPAEGPLGRVPDLGGPLLPPGDRGRQGRDPDPDAHVLLGLRRHPRAHPGDGCRRQPDRGRPLTHGAARTTGRGPATETTSARASTTSTHRGSRASTRWSNCSMRRRTSCDPSRSG